MTWFRCRMAPVVAFTACLSWATAFAGGEASSEDAEEHGATDGTATTQSVNAFLAKTAPLRESPRMTDSHPITADDLKSFDVLSDPEGTGADGHAVLEFICVCDDGRSVLGQVTTEDGIVRIYLGHDLRKQIADDLETGAWSRTALKPLQAVTQAKSYVAAMRGGFPDDLLVASAFYRDVPSADMRKVDPQWRDHMQKDAGCWTVEFRRYAGDLPYEGECVKITFSERHGVQAYTDRYYSRPWRGKIVIRLEDAMRTAQAHADEYFDKEFKDAVFRLPPYVVDGRPELMNVVKDDPRAVHAVWEVVFPYSHFRLKDVGFNETGEGRHGVYIDAETGEYIE